MTYTPIPAGTPDWDVPVNAAFTDQDTRITTNAANVSTLQAQGPTVTGVYTPPGWGQWWRAKRNNASVASAKVMAIGDSITQGYYSSNLKTKSWVGLMRTALQNSYGDGGTGMFSVSSTQVVLGVDAGVAADWTANGSLAATTGAWVSGTPIGFGPGITHMRTTAAATITFTNVVGTSIKLWYLIGGAPRAAWQYTIDGGAPVNVPGTTGTTAVTSLTVTGLANTAHTVVITWNGTAGDILDFIGVAGEKATGIIVDNLARSGTGAINTQWGNTSASTAPFNGGINNPCDLAIVGLGVNDASLSSLTGDNWAGGMGTLLSAIKAANNGMTDIILVHNHYGSLSNAGFYGQYSSQIRDLADNYGAMLVNLWLGGRNNWDYKNSLNYWGTGTSPAGATGNNSVHPSDVGHQAISDLITPLVLS